MQKTPDLSRDEVFENFRKFVKDVGQQGDTLGTVAPPKLKGTKSLIAKRTFLMRKSYKPETPVAAISLIFPTELCWAAEYVPFNWEMFASLLASHSKVIELTNTGSAPVPRCSFINALKGAQLTKILPAPNVILSSTAFCEGIGHMFGELKELYNREHLHIDIPSYYSKDALANTVIQLKNMFHSICDINNISQNKRLTNLREAMYYSTLAKLEHNELVQLRIDNPQVNLGLEPLHWHMLFSAFWGDKAGYEVCKQLKNDFIGEIDKEHEKGTPISFFSLIPYGRSDLWRKIKDAGAYSTFEGVNYLSNELKFIDVEEIHSCTENELFENMAYNLIHSPMRGLDMASKTERFMKDAKNTSAKGMVIFTHEHCQMLAVRLDEIEKAATKANLKSVSISGDCILGMPPGPAGIRLGTFLNSITGNKKTLNKIDGNSLSIIKRGVNDWRVGVDFGSGFSKYTVIDNDNKVIKSEMFNSGIDYPHLLKEIKARIGNSRDIHFAVAGVGGDNPHFKNFVSTQTTEISALIQAVRTICANQNDFTVIDIGTQDVKILKFNDLNEEPWVNTNKSCGAGTGMVLKQILERWQQTNPEINFTDLDEMAFNAENSELVNTTCGIFAVTNVVSALVQSNTKRRKEILRGVYEYIAEQAIRLLPHNDKHGGLLLLTGGIANHKTLQLIFTERGFNLIGLPSQIHPQYIVAYGTALTVN